MAPRHGFVTGGCWVVDRNRTLPFWPEEDLSIGMSAPLQRGGGSACNFALDVRKLDPDMPVETIGLIGDDAEGRFLLDLAAEYGIGAAQLQVTTEAPTHVAEAFQSLRSGRRTHLFHGGASDRLSPDHFDLARTTGRILHLGLPGICEVMDAPWRGEPNGWVEVLKRAQAAGLETNLELVTAPRETLVRVARPCLPHLNTLIVNDYEIGALTQGDTVADGVTDEAACLIAARRALEYGAMDVVVVHYVLGACLVARDGTEIRMPSVQVPEQAFVGANGAGDAFAAGFLYARHEGWTYEQCLKLAHATAASCLRSIATSDSIVSVRECLNLAAAWGWRG